MVMKPPQVVVGTTIAGNFFPNLLMRGANIVAVRNHLLRYVREIVEDARCVWDSGEQPIDVFLVKALSEEPSCVGAKFPKYRGGERKFDGALRFVVFLIPPEFEVDRRGELNLRSP
jgi:hypothetical protein